MFLRPLKNEAVLVLLAALAPGLLTSGKTAGNVYENRACGIRFQYPEDWLIREVPASGHGAKARLCGIRVQPKDLARHLKEDGNVDVYSIDIDVEKTDFKSAAASGGFERRETRWVVLGEAEAPADEISSPEWIGLKATVASRCYREDDGGYAGQCETFRAVLSNRADVSAIVDGQPMSEETFELVVKSFKFSRPVPSNN